MSTRRTIVRGVGAAAILFMYGCASAPDSAHRGLSGGRSPSQSARKYGQQAGEPVSTVIDARPAALVNGQAVTWGELRVQMTEMAGAEALQEFVLDRKIAEALATAQITIDPDDVVGERKLLLESLSDDADVSIRLLDELRDRQRLGPARFEAMLRRNAGLRALVRDKVTMNESAVQAMHDLVHGPKRQARLIIVPDLKAAEAAKALMRAGSSFADVAVELSTDASAARGGLLQPMSRHDPAYPEALRQAIWSLSVGETSSPILLENSYAMVMLVKSIPAEDVTLDLARPRLERLVRINQERLLMDELARKMLAETTVSVFDDALNDSWKRHRRER